MTELFDRKLGDVLTFQRGHDITKKEQSPGQFPVISSGGASSTHVEYRYEGPGVVIGRKGSLGGVYWSEGPYWPHDTTLWVRDFKGNDPKYLYYFLQTLQLERFDAGASNPTLNRNHLHLLEVSVLPPDQQRSVADRLSAFDDLIENNRRRIEILEEIARLLYREWFVHFRYPGHEDVELVDSELGPIPEGWEVKRISEVASVNKGLSYKGAHLTDDGLPMANLKCLAPSGGFARRGTKGYDGPFKERHAILPGDILVANTDLTQAGNVIGSAGMVPRAGFEDGGLLSHHLFRVRPQIGSFTLLRALQSDRMRALARSVASGTTVLGMRTDDFERFALAWPPDELLADFESTQQPMHQLIENLHDQNAVLQEARDLLLPRLVSGELDVSELDLDGVLA